MNHQAEADSGAKALAPFQKGQIWRMGDENLAVTLVGKTLVHYRRYKTQPRMIRTTVASKAALEQYLVANQAVQVGE